MATTPTEDNQSSGQALHRIIRRGSARGKVKKNSKATKLFSWLFEGSLKTALVSFIGFQAVEIDLAVNKFRI